MKISLTWYEWQCAALVGIFGQCDALRTGREHRFGGLTGSNGLDPSTTHLHFAGAELAVAKAFDHYWPPVIGKKEAKELPDVMPNLQVRWTNLPKGKLILHEDDKDDQIYILVRGLGPDDYDIVGWCYGYEGKRPQWFFTPNDRPPAYFVPEEALRKNFARRQRELS